MASNRRLGLESSATRELIVDAASEVLQEQGAARLTAARVAQKAGVKAHLVHYYFRNMDDLVVAVVRAYGRKGVENASAALISDQPLRAFWEAEVGFDMNAAVMEFSAVASHREAVQDELKLQIEAIRRLQAEAIDRHFQLLGAEPPIATFAISVILSAVARQLVRERQFGVTLGHEETMQVVEEQLASIAALSPPRL